MSNSREVNSNQTGINRNLEKTVKRHIHSIYQKPFQEHNLIAFEILQETLASNSFSSLLLDSCCGTAKSSMTLAEQHPDSLVVGIDQSFVRLNKRNTLDNQPNNCLLLRANCEDFWRLCDEHAIYFDSHYILYPNPWPKSVHLKRRWHGHPVFSVLPRLASTTILRSNWSLYLEEFQRAWCLLTGENYSVRRFKTQDPLTLFEKKYAESSQPLYQLILGTRENLN